MQVYTNIYQHIPRYTIDDMGIPKYTGYTRVYQYVQRYTKIYEIYQDTRRYTKTYKDMPRYTKIYCRLITSYVKFENGY